MLKWWLPGKESSLWDSTEKDCRFALDKPALREGSGPEARVGPARGADIHAALAFWGCSKDSVCTAGCHRGECFLCTCWVVALGSGSKSGFFTSQRGPGLSGTSLNIWLRCALLKSRSLQVPDFNLGINGINTHFSWSLFWAGKIGTGSIRVSKRNRFTA